MEEHDCLTIYKSVTDFFANNVFVQILEDTNILFPDDELDILDLDEDELLFEVCSTEDFIVHDSHRTTNMVMVMTTASTTTRRSSTTTSTRKRRPR